MNDVKSSGMRGTTSSNKDLLQEPPITHIRIFTPYLAISPGDKSFLVTQKAISCHLCC